MLSIQYRKNMRDAYGLSFGGDGGRSGGVAGVQIRRCHAHRGDSKLAVGIVEDALVEHGHFLPVGTSTDDREGVGQERSIESMRAVRSPVDHETVLIGEEKTLRHEKTLAHTFSSLRTIQAIKENIRSATQRTCSRQNRWMEDDCAETGLSLPEIHRSFSVRVCIPTAFPIRIAVATVIGPPNNRTRHTNYPTDIRVGNSGCGILKNDKTGHSST